MMNSFDASLSQAATLTCFSQKILFVREINPGTYCLLATLSVK
jgi:hypothetical protein